jgi:hypothetical protein
MFSPKRAAKTPRDLKLYFLCTYAVDMSDECPE